MRVFAIHMAVCLGMLVVGWAMVERTPAGSIPSNLALALLIGSVLIRSGIVPTHCWMTDLFEHASFGRALMFVTPMVGVYATVRLLLPIAPEWALRSIALISLFTAVYAAGMALVQREARRFFCYLFLSHSSLVLVGLEIATPVGLTGALSLWISVGLALTGFGLTLRSIEARIGRVSLNEFHGLYEHTPALAAFFLITGLASIGFPGTIGFVGAELLVEGAVDVYPWVGLAVVLAAALNGIAVMHAYFRIFTGKRFFPTISLQSRLPERVAVLILAALILGGGLYPQPSLSSRYHAASEIIKARRHLAGPTHDHQAHRRALWFNDIPIREPMPGREVDAQSSPHPPRDREPNRRARG
jgi:NADH-quinone oxidoreductase subunit M